MILGERTRVSVTSALIKIRFKGYLINISITGDDPFEESDLNHACIRVYRSGEEVTASLSKEINSKKVTAEGVMNATGDDLFKIMQAIANMS